MTGKQLKNAILKLAIQGKLVAQDPADEPAAVLLAKIRKEKEQLLKAGKLKKKDLETTPITDDEKPFEIPENWEWVRLGEIGSWGSGATPAKGKPEYYNNGTIPWIRTGELNNGYVFDSEIKVTQKALDNCSLRMCSKGDVLIAMYGATIGKVAIAGIELTTNQACCACTPIIIFNKYLMWYLLASKQAFVELGEGGAQPNISREKIVVFPFALPPLAEQRRIVAKIEELMPLVEEFGAAQEKLNQLNEALPEALKKSILHQAIQGKLVPPACRLAGKILPTSQLPSEETGVWYVYVIECEDGSFYKGFTVNLQKRYKEHCSGNGAEWTKKHKPKQLYYYEIQYSEEAALKREKYLKSGFGREWFKREVVDKPAEWEPASALLARIRKEKEQLVKAGKLKPVCRQAGKKDLETTPIPDDEKPFEIPESWEWVRLGDCVSNRAGLAYSKGDLDKKSSDMIRVLRGGNISYGSWKKEDNDVMIAREFVSDELLLKKGTFITPAVTSLENMGKTALIDEDLYDTVVGGFVLMLQSFFYENSLLKYLLYFFCSAYYKEYCKSITNKSGQAFYNISRAKLMNLPIPLPPLAEQRRIVARVEELMEMVEGME